MSAIVTSAEIIQKKKSRTDHSPSHDQVNRSMRTLERNSQYHQQGASAV